MEKRYMVEFWESNERTRIEEMGASEVMQLIQKWAEKPFKFSVTELGNCVLDLS